MAVFCLLGCSADDTDTANTAAGDPSDNAASADDCIDDPRAERFTPGMAKHTASSTRVVLVEVNPTPPARLDNSWLIALEDSEGAPLAGVPIAVKPTMPDHGHGSPREAQVMDLGDGSYRVEPVALFMPGYWQVEVIVRPGDAAAQSVQFGFCVP